MPIRLVLNKDDPNGRPWHVSNGPFVTGKFIQTPVEKGRAVLRVQPCISHEPPVAVVPVILEKWDPDLRTNVEVGTGSACPVCWTVMKSQLKSS